MQPPNRKIDSLNMRGRLRRPVEQTRSSSVYSPRSYAGDIVESRPAARRRAPHELPTALPRSLDGERPVLAAPALIQPAEPAMSNSDFIEVDQAVEDEVIVAEAPDQNETWAQTDTESTESNNSTKKPSKPRGRKRHVVFLGLAAMLFVAGGMFGYDVWRSNEKVVAQVEQLKQSKTKPSKIAGMPSTDKPADSIIRGFAVEPDRPKYIEISKLNVLARTLPMSISTDNQLESPKNIFDAGWVSDSALPGAAGAMLVGGHGQVGEAKGIFSSLSSLVAGDEIVITKGDDTKHVYSVVRVETKPVSQVDMNDLIVSADPKKPGLNLITYSGSQSPGTAQSEKRTSVFAVLK